MQRDHQRQRQPQTNCRIYARVVRLSVRWVNVEGGGNVRVCMCTYIIGRRVLAKMCQAIVSKSILTFSFCEVDIKCAIFIIFLTFITFATTALDLLVPIKFQLTVKLTLHLSSFFLAAPSNFKSLCLRAEVLLKLSHYQSSLADIENALKTRCTSPKVSEPPLYSESPLKLFFSPQAHYLRALALSGLGRLEDALFNGFLAICLDKNTNLSNSEIFQHDLAKVS